MERPIAPRGTAERLAALDDGFGLSVSHNSEIRFAWLDPLNLTK